jgi:hypothetical protein
MRTLNIRHPAMRGLADAVLDLFPNGADVSEVGSDKAPCLFVSWRTSGLEGHPGNIGWGVHYRFESGLLSVLHDASESARQDVWARVREWSRALRFDYADPDAVSLLVLDIGVATMGENSELDHGHSSRVT